MRLGQKLRIASARLASKLNDPRRRGVPLVFVEPAYWIIDRLTAESVIIDMGLGFDADFSVAMINRYGLQSFGFDPTLKHESALRELETRTDGRFRYNRLAIGGKAGTVTFHESEQNVSGSLLDDHHNVRHDRIRDYEVELITIADAVARVPGGRLDLVKVDIEGAEYDALEGTSDDVLTSVDQWCIEFHHNQFNRFTFAMTKQQIARFARLGFEVFTHDSANFLFYRSSQVMS